MLKTSKVLSINTRSSSQTAGRVFFKRVIGARPSSF